MLSWTIDSIYNHSLTKWISQIQVNNTHHRFDLISLTFHAFPQYRIHHRKITWLRGKCPTWNGINVTESSPVSPAGNNLLPISSFADSSTLPLGLPMPGKSWSWKSVNKINFLGKKKKKIKQKVKSSKIKQEKYQKKQNKNLSDESGAE